jgi:hypothetical protein
VTTDVLIESVIRADPGSNKRFWAGRIVSSLTVAFLLVDGAMKVMRAPAAVVGTVQLGYPESVLPGIGILLLACTLLYAIPRTSVLGAILLTGYLGGAVATQVRVGNPIFTHVLFPVYVAVMVWGGPFLRDHRLRIIVPSNY